MRLRSLASLVVAISLVAGCSSEKRANAGAAGGTVIVAMGGDAGSLFPLLIVDETGKAVTDLLFDHLAQIGPELSTIGDAGFEPRLARSWDWARDSMSIVFHLDPAARFHDGTPVTANDVRYTFRIASDTALGSSFTPLVANIDSISVVDSLTPVAWFKKRSPEQFYDVVYQLAVVPEHVYGKVPTAQLKTSDITRQPVGTGRFRMGKWEPGVRIEIVADTANYRGRAKLDRAIFMLAQSPTAAATGILTGQTDFYSSFPIDQVAGLDSSSVARPVPLLVNGYGFLGINAYERKSRTKPHPILGDVAVRRAIAMSVDRAAMLKNVFNASGVLAHGPFPTGSADGDTTLKIPAYDTTAAKAMLDAAGWKAGANGVRMKNGRPLKLEFLAPTSSLPRMRYAELIQEQLNRVGFQIEMARAANPEFMPRLASGDFDLMILTINTDPSVSGAKQYWTSESVGQQNYLGYHHPSVDADIDSASKARDLATMKRYASRAYQKVIDDVPAVFLYSAGYIAAANRRIDLAPLPRDGWWGRLSEWSIPADKQIDRDRVGLRPATP